MKLVGTYHMGLNKCTIIDGQSVELVLKQYYDSNTVTDSFLVRVPVFSAAMQLHQALDGSEKRRDTSWSLAVCNSLFIGNRRLLV